MDMARQREIVLEIERVRVVRRRMKTSLLSCRGCAKSTDFVELAQAAKLFGITNEELYDFISTNRCHFNVGCGGDIFVCVTDLLAAMSRRLKTANFKLLGGSSE